MTTKPITYVRVPSQTGALFTERALDVMVGLRATVTFGDASWEGTVVSAKVIEEGHAAWVGVRSEQDERRDE